jgi:hypothetical protein
MTTPDKVESLSLISIDVGSVNTRAHFFDNVEGRYRFLATGAAPSTLGAPVFDLNLGVLEALEQLQEFTGRTFLTDSGLLISRDNGEGAGANAISVTFAGALPLKVMTVGLLDEISLDSANMLVRSSYFRVVDSLGLNDRRPPEAIIDAICNTLPDLVVMAGGTNEGASRSVIRLANYLALALNLIPEKQRPQVLFVGNEKLHDEIDNVLGALTMLHLSPNIRPYLEQESFGPARQALNAIYFDLQSRKMNGLLELRELSEGQIYPAAYALGRVVRFLSTVIDTPKGMLGIDIGGLHTTVASAFAGELQLRVFPELGVGAGLPGMIAETHLPQIMRWLPYDLPEDLVLDYLYNKPLFAGTLPSTPEEMAIEQAAARQVMRLAIENSLSLFPPNAIYPMPGALPWFDRILVSGSAVARAPRMEQSLLMILDAIQPVGIATVILDQNNLVNAVGATAEIDPVMAVHVLESNSFINLGTVISPVGNMRGRGNPLLRVQIVHEGEKEDVVEIREGTIKSIPLPPGRVVDIYVDPLQNVNIGLGRGRGGWVRRVAGGVFGLIIDARGRPIQVPSSLNRRQETLNSWQQELITG